MTLCTSVLHPWNVATILGVDPTFSLGDFEVTVMTYCHLLLHHQGDPHGNSPCLIGPLFVHLKKDFAVYHFFASSLISLRTSLSNLKCFGSDREDTLMKAFSTAFSNAIHLRCFLHFRGNIEEKLRQLLQNVVLHQQQIRYTLDCPKFNW